MTTSPADYFFKPGSLDTSFNTGTGATSGSSALPQFVQPVALQPDGKVVIGGAFLFYNDVPRNRLARINSDGTLDNSFNPGAGAGIKALYGLQPDGKFNRGLFTRMVVNASAHAVEHRGPVDTTSSVPYGRRGRAIVVQRWKI